MRVISTRNLIATGCAAMPAVTAVPFLMVNPEFAKFATTRAARSTFPGDMWAECSAIPSRRSLSSMLIPGALAYSFGMLGCDLHCAYCQNWVTSQALRDPDAVSQPLQASPEALVQDALARERKFWSALTTSL